MTPPATKSFLENWTFTSPAGDGRQPRMVGALRRLEATLGQVERRMPSPNDAKESLKALEHGWGRGGGINALPGRHLRQFAWVLFQPWARNGPDLPGDAPFVAAYREWLMQNPSGVKVSRLIPPYLRFFPEDAAFREDWRRFLADAVTKHSGGRLATWKRRHQEFGLLEADGATRFAQSIVKSPQRYGELLEAAGLTGFLADSQFVRVAHQSLIREIADVLQSGSNLSRSQCDALLSSLETSSPATLRFQDLRSEVAETLLGPWTQRTPPEPVKQSVRAFLQRHLGNPNISRGRWGGVPEASRKVFLRWLAEDALAAFFEILDRTALDRQWRERKAFWEDYLNENLISDAWLALGPTAGALANRVLKLPNGSCAALEGAASNQSVLIMRIRNITIVEWSHQGAARMWLDGHPSVPKLYEPTYTADRLRSPADIRIVHHVNLEWRGRTASWIKKQTGLMPVQVWRQR